MQWFALLNVLGFSTAASFKKPAAPVNKEFGLMMSVGYGDINKNLSLSAVRNGTSTGYFLVGEELAKAPGTPAYFNGTNPQWNALDMKIHGCTYGLSVPDTGDIHGIATAVTAGKGSQDNGWASGHGVILHDLTSAAPWFLACNWTIQGQKRSVLAWGSMYSNGSYVDGCEFSQVYQRCNVKGSTANCA